MRRFLIEYRFVISLALAAIAGAAGLRAWPFPAGNPLLGLIEVNQPAIYAGFSYAYATAWFSTPFFLIKIVFSFVYIFVARPDRRVKPAALYFALTPGKVVVPKEIESMCNRRI
jgi:hypothetical protein